MIPIAEATDYDSFIAALRARQAALGVNNETLEDLARLPDRYLTKLFGPAQIKTLGPSSFGGLLKALAVKIVLVEDVEAAKTMAIRWEQRKVPVNKPGAPSMAFVQRKFAPTLRRHMSKIGRKGAKGYLDKVSPARRSKIARHAARARWRRHRERRAKAATPPAPHDGQACAAASPPAPARGRRPQAAGTAGATSRARPR